jgi:hypothetical protein
MQIEYVYFFVLTNTIVNAYVYKLNVRSGQMSLLLARLYDIQVAIRVNYFKRPSLEFVAAEVAWQQRTHRAQTYQLAFRARYSRFSCTWRCNFVRW